jgi:hypothetical protein
MAPTGVEDKLRRPAIAPFRVEKLASLNANHGASVLGVLYIRTKRQIATDNLRQARHLSRILTRRSVRRQNNRDLPTELITTTTTTTADQ